MTNQQKKKNISFSQSGMWNATTSTIYMRRFPIRLEKPGDELLAKHFSYFNYEVDMLHFANSKLNKLVPERDRFKREGNKSKQGECTAEINMALETFVVHWRALIEFFYKTERRSDDMRVDDFIDKSKWQKTRESMPSWVKKLNCRAGKEIAHLTSSRKYGTPPEKNWPYKEMREHLEAIITVFVKEAKLQISQGE